jgi:hypothetical protein
MAQRQSVQAQVLAKFLLRYSHEEYFGGGIYHLDEVKCFIPRQVVIILFFFEGRLFKLPKKFYLCSPNKGMVA